MFKAVSDGREFMCGVKTLRWSTYEGKSPEARRTAK
jgi:hypothetical protein